MCKFARITEISNQPVNQMSDIQNHPLQDQAGGPQQKIVRLSGQSSMLMNGDDTYPRTRDDVLPRLLANGWRITSLIASADGNGYALLTK